MNDQDDKDLGRPGLWLVVAFALGVTACGGAGAQAIDAATPSGNAGAGGASGAAGDDDAPGGRGGAGAAGHEAGAGTDGSAGVEARDAAGLTDAPGAIDAAAPDEAGAGHDPDDACPGALVGWAAVAGDGVTTTTGGGTVTPVRPTSAAELLAYAGDATPRVIEIVGTFSLPRLQVASNKTLVGIGTDATLAGGLRIRGTADAPVRNVIVRNLRVNGASTTADGDAAQIYYAHHVWIDHCDIWDGPDGNLDLTHAVNWVTISWTKFRYTSAYKAVPGETTAAHRFSSLVGHSDDNAAEDDGRLKISFHHDWWAEGVLERMPRVRFGQVHVFNNYFSSAGNHYCVRAGRGAHLLVEGNAFDGVNDPQVFNSPADEATASITARDNLYSKTTGMQATGGGGAALTSVPYAATIEPAAGAAARVRACAGPR
jgi:pectate lyase